MKKEELTALGLNEDQIKGVQKLTVLTSKQFRSRRLMSCSQRLMTSPSN